MPVRSPDSLRVGKRAHLDGLSHADAIVGLYEAPSKVKPAGIVAREQRDVVLLKQEELGHGQIVEGGEVQVLQLQQSLAHQYV